MSASKTIYTIGYGNRTGEEFIGLLQLYHIELICDVRSSPYSSRYATFSREPLHAMLKDAGLKYIFLGDLLGARPSDPDCYEDGRASYQAMAKSSAFERGIERLELGCEKHRIAIMCAEKDPFDCHRAILLSKRLAKDGIGVSHIDADGQVQTQPQLEARLMKRFKLQQASLFDARSTDEALDEAYERRGRELAYDVTAAYGVGSE